MIERLVPEEVREELKDIYRRMDEIFGFDRENMEHQAMAMVVWCVWEIWKMRGRK
jgi:hypothetical protein